MEPLINSLRTEAREYLQRPQKKFRSDLVALGFRTFSANEDPSLSILFEAIEELHSGSLIIDDIQDQALERRGHPAKHRQIGIPRAINLGNWMYFQALLKISTGPWNVDIKSQMFDVAMHCLSDAHEGQELDLDPNFLSHPPERIDAHAAECLRLKTGALTRLAVLWGAVVGDVQRYKDLSPFAENLGILLQQSEDISHWRMLERPSQKNREEITSLRPSFVWSVIARHQPTKKQKFVEAARAYEDKPQFLIDLCQSSKVVRIADEENHVFLRKFVESLHSREDIFNDQACASWIRMIERIVSAY